MKLRDFTLTANELPPTNVYVLGYWAGEPAQSDAVGVGAFNVVRVDADGIWWASDPDISDDYIAPTSWSHLPGGIDLNRADFRGKFEIDLDAEV